MDEISRGESFYNNLSQEAMAMLAEKEISKDEAIKLFNKMYDFVDAVKSAINRVIPAIKEVATSLGNAYGQILASCPNKRVVHLAKHGKRLTRKKNIKRISRWLDQ